MADIPVPDQPSRSRRGRKRANGEGTIYQRKDGRWEGAAFVLTTAGTHRRVRVYGTSREDARRSLTSIIRQSDQGIPAASSAWTLAEYLTSSLRYIVRQDPRPKPFKCYKALFPFPPYPP